jgi:hypothetical protein
MELIKKRILLEDSIDRNYNSDTYGTLTATSFYINIFLTQNIDDMGMFTNTEFIATNNTPVDYSLLIDKLSVSGYTFPFMTNSSNFTISSNNPDIRLINKLESDYFINGGQVSANTESRLNEVKTYKLKNPFILDFDVKSEEYVNYSGKTIMGVNRVTQIGNNITYVIDADKNDVNIGTNKQKNGFLFVDSSSSTTLNYLGQGWNDTNLSLSAITKEEYLFGIISKPEIKSDVFIDRGITTIFEKQLKLSEITNLDELTKYGRGFYNITKY